MNVQRLTVILAVVCQMAGFSVQASETSAPAKPGIIQSVWVNPVFISRHFNRSTELKENNYGLGVQVALSQTNSVIGGEFRNSRDTRSRYLAWVWQPLGAGLVRAGLLAGAIDGYPRMHNGGWFPVVVPVVSIEYKAVGINLTVVPSYKDKLDGAVAAQFKLRIW